MVQLSNDGLAVLVEALPKLTELGLNGTQVTNAGLAALARLSELHKLSLQWCRGINNAGAYCASMVSCNAACKSGN
jgi:hypothetical protein